MFPQICWPNEADKSTVHALLARMIFDCSDYSQCAFPFSYWWCVQTFAIFGSPFILVIHYEKRLILNINGHVIPCLICSVDEYLWYTEPMSKVSGENIDYLIFDCCKLKITVSRPTIFILFSKCYNFAVILRLFIFLLYKYYFYNS